MKHFKSNNIFQNVKANRPPKSLFDLSHNVKGSYRMGRIYPFYVQECVPGDSFTINAEVMTRMAPMIAPVMHNLKAYMHFFKVPMRLVYDDWGSFITGRKGTSSFEGQLPYIDLRDLAGNLSLIGKYSLLHHLGMPPITGQPNSEYKVNGMMLRAVNLIYNEYYINTFLQEPRNVLKTGGIMSYDEVNELTEPLIRNYEKDYLTSALPYPQRNDDDVLLPLMGSAPVTVTGTYTGTAELAGIRKLDNSSLDNELANVQTDANGNQIVTEGPGVDRNYAEIYGNISTSGTSTGSADLSMAEAGTVSDLREAFAIQRFFERLARSGQRYIEYIKAFFDVNSSDARLQRPEYLGGGATNIMFSEVLQNSQTDETPQGTMAGHGIGVGASNTINTFCEEHCYIIGLISYLPETGYQEGVPRMFRHLDKFDFYNPSFAHLGEQPVRNDEVYFDVTASDDNNSNAGTFGFQSRYSEYRSAQNRTVGDFTDSLNFWHLNRKFGSLPSLNAEFLQCRDIQNELTRIFAVEDDVNDYLWSMIHINVIAKRPMPFDAEPGFIDHY